MIPHENRANNFCTIFISKLPISWKVFTKLTVLSRHQSLTTLQNSTSLFPHSNVEKIFPIPVVEENDKQKLSQYCDTFGSLDSPLIMSWTNS